MATAWARPKPGGGPQPWLNVNPSNLSSYSAFMRRSGLGAVLPDVNYDVSLVPLTQPPPLPSSALTFQPVSMSGSPSGSKFDLWANRITNLAQQAANIIQQFRTPSGQTVTYAVPAETVQSQPGVGAGMQFDQSGVKGEVKISTEMLLIGGLVLVVLLSSKKK